MWSGGTATTVSWAAPSGGAGVPAPSPLAVRTCSWLVSLSQTSRPARCAARPTEVPSRPAPTTWIGPASSGIGHRSHPSEVTAQRGGTVQVDVGDVLARQVGLHVRHHAHHPRHRGVDLEL